MMHEKDDKVKWVRPVMDLSRSTNVRVRWGLMTDALDLVRSLGMVLSFSSKEEATVWARTNGYPLRISLNVRSTTGQGDSSVNGEENTKKENEKLK